jgi:hypothetical protein
VHRAQIVALEVAPGWWWPCVWVGSVHEVRLMMGGVVEAYRARSPSFAHRFERSMAVFAGGETRSTLYFEPHPQAISRGFGSRVVDVDRNELPGRPARCCPNLSFDADLPARRRRFLLDGATARRRHGHGIPL